MNINRSIFKGLPFFKFFDIYKTNYVIFYLLLWQVTHLKQNVSWREPPNVKVDGCFYSGNVFGEPSSIVTVSLCDGIVSILNIYFFSYK